MKAKATTVSRQESADDPVFAAIEKHRLALHAWQASMGGETREDDEITQQLLHVERDAWRAWLTTQPTTPAGMIATLEYAGARPYSARP